MRRLALLAAALLCGAAPADAQGGPSRPALDDLVRRITADGADLASLGGHPALRVPGLRGRLARAWLDLAAAERDTGYAELADVADRFGFIAERHPDWSLASVGLSRAAILLHGRRDPAAPNYAGMPRGRHYIGYVFHLAQALRHPEQLGAGEGFIASRLLHEGERMQPPEVMEAMAAVAGRADADPRLDLVLARDARAREDAAGSLAHLDRFLARGGDPGVGRLERARTLTMLGETDEAVRDYHTGLAHRSAEGRAAYRTDVAWVATREELRAFDALDADSVTAWVERFWALRDARDFRARDERLAEHLRRWVTVHRTFRVPAADRREHVSRIFITVARIGQGCLDGPRTLDDVVADDPSIPDDARGDERVLDHRAVLWMRHGPPLRRRMRSRLGTFSEEFTRASVVGDRTPKGNGDASAFTGSTIASTVVAPGQRPHSDAYVPSDAQPRDEIWLYLIDGAPRIYMFSDSEALGLDRASTLFTARIPSMEDVAFLLAGLPLRQDEHDQILRDASTAAMQVGLSASGGSLTGGSFFCSAQGQRLLAAVQSDVRLAASTDGFAPRFEHALAASVRVYALGQPARGTGRLVVAIGADTRSFAGTGGDVDATLTITTLDPARATSARRVTPLRLPAPGTSRDASAAAVYSLLPGHREVRMLLQQDSTRGSVFAATVEPAAAGGLAVSDLVLGADGLPIADLGGRRVAVSPTGAFTRRGGLRIYYELYELVPGREYRSRLTLRGRREDPARDAVSLSFTDRAAGPVLALERGLTLPDVPRGEYVLELTVTDAESGAVVVRRQPVYIVR